MDEGFAAVIAGLAGAIGGASGAAFGAVATARAMARQVRDQATTEHGQWIRDQRMQAYLTLMQEWDAAHKRLKNIWTQAEDAYYQDLNHILQGDIGEIFNVFLDQLEEATAPTTTAFERVAMLGPSEVDNAALELEQALQRLRAATKTRLSPAQEPTTPEAWNSEPWDESDLAAAGARQVFVDRVRRVLDIPPTPMPRT
ncbi:hypothetical protein OHB35_00595 [Streptomyces phaeochromogenes]|uniref:Uncharacterized protein n=1 Tax=Streptomyces phaeochromogenes TaxID=1923 RepID=A0ABZ1H004_STRPH|nr:hypothetical protein [Streptomyces phaeochromogenes]WSD11833.1 hypothetical protein OHB35_00595 [Streptomyces phaeochromogenes]